MYNVKFCKNFPKSRTGTSFNGLRQWECPTYYFAVRGGYSCAYRTDLQAQRYQNMR